MNKASSSENSWNDCLYGLPEQIEAVTSRASLTVISAGAGTGKTETLAQRVAWLLADDPDCSVTDILVLTFTEKASREMRDRIRQTISKWHDKYPKELAHLEKSIKSIDDASISTIHAFGMKVIRESGLLLDLDPSSAIAPAPREDIWWKDYGDALSSLSLKSIRPLLSEEWLCRAEELFSSEKIVDFVNCYGADTLSSAAKSASEQLGSKDISADALWNWPCDNLEEDIASLSWIFDDIWDIWMKDLFPLLIDDIRKDAEKKETSQKLFSLFDSYGSSAADEDAKRAFARELLCSSLSNLNKISAKVKDAISDRIGVKLKDWRDEYLKLIRKASYPSDEEKTLTQMAGRVCALGWYCWERIREKESILSMNDLIRCAKEVLEKDAEYGKRFKRILVDEFQDTDGLQDMLLKSLWHEGSNTLFLVGDLKQSIYRFRHADLKIFQSYIDMARNCDDGKYLYISLDKNFRTRESLLVQFNTIFSEIWQDGLERGTTMKYEPLYRPDGVDWMEERNKECSPHSAEAIIAVQNNDAESGKELVDDARYRLFCELAVRTAKMHEEKMNIWDKEAKALRPVRWKDFALLVPTRTSYRIIERAFEAASVPYVLCTGKEYYTRGEVTDIINLVSLASEPENPFFLAGWLSSPFSNMSADSLSSLLTEAAERKEKYKDLPLSALLKEKFPKQYEKIKELRNIGELKGASSMIRSLSKDRGYLAYFEPEQRKRVAANIAALARIAAEYESSQGMSLAGCADYLSFAVNTSVRKEEPDITDESQDSVKVLTIHTSKGLEYPVTLVAGAEAHGTKTKSIGISSRYGVVMQKIPEAFCSHEPSEEKTVSGAWFADREAEAEKSEKERLWYVAATRTRDKLLLCGTAKTAKGEKIPTLNDESFLGKVLSLKEKLQENFAVNYIDKNAKKSEMANLRAEEAEEGKVLELKTVSPAKLARLSASAYSMIAWCPYAYRIAYRQGREMEWTVKSGERGSGSEFGSLAHLILSKWDYKAESLMKFLPSHGTESYQKVMRTVPLELREEYRSKKSAEELRSLLLGYAATDEGLLLSKLVSDSTNDKKIFRETPFRVQDKDLLLVGSADIFWEDENIINLRDWKTTSESFAPSEYYDAQLSFYAYAIFRYRQEMSLPFKSISVGINYLRPCSNAKKTVLYNEEQLFLCGDAIHKAAEDALCGDFYKNKEKCYCCPWKTVCPK